MTQAYTQRFTEVHQLIGFDVDTMQIGTYGILTYVSMANHQRAIALLHVDDMAAGATVDLALWQAKDIAGTGAKVIAGKSITQLTQAGGDGDDSCAIEVRTEEMDVNGGYSFISAVLTVAGGTAVIGLIGLLCGNNQIAVPVATWTEIID